MSDPVPNGPDPSELRVLFVDDHADTLTVLVLLLRERFRVATCGSAAEAVAALDTARPDVVVLDIGMAPIDGLQCLAAIRARPAYADLPVIALTAHARELDRRRFLASGFAAVVTKPLFDEEVLVRAIVDAARTRAA